MHSSIASESSKVMLSMYCMLLRIISTWFVGGQDAMHVASEVVIFILTSVSTFSTHYVFIVQEWPFVTSNRRCSICQVSVCVCVCAGRRAVGQHFPLHATFALNYIDGISVGQLCMFGYPVIFEQLQANRVKVHCRSNFDMLNWWIMHIQIMCFDIINKNRSADLWLWQSEWRLASISSQ